MINFISVVVPVFNVQEYLDKCIKSILNQSYTNFELILVDDGSTDNSGLICEKFAKLDSRVLVKHKVNGGLSDARNYGIRVSSGELITFIDSDDYVGNNYLSNLLKAMQDSAVDISVSKTVYLSRHLKYSDSEKIEILSSEDALIEMFYQKKFETNACGKLYRTKLFKDNLIEYPIGKIYEDLATTYRLFLNSTKISLIDTHDYFYLDKRENSIMNKEFSIKEMDVVPIIEKILFEMQNKSEKVWNATLTRSISSLANVYLSIPRGKKYFKYKKEIINIIFFAKKNVKITSRMRFKNIVFILFLKLLPISSEFDSDSLNTM